MQRQNGFKAETRQRQAKKLQDMPGVDSRASRTILYIYELYKMYTRSSAVAKRPRDASCLPAFVTCEMVAVVHLRPCLQHHACCSVNSRQWHIGSESRFLPTAPAFNAPVRGVPVGISPSRLVRKN